MKKALSLMIVFFSWSAFANPVEFKCTLDQNIDDFIDMPEEISYLITRAGSYVLKIEEDFIPCEASAVNKVMNLLCQDDFEDEDEGVYLSIKENKLILSDYQTFSVMATYDCRVD